MKYKILIGAVVLLFLGGIIGCLIVMNAPKKNTVTIKRDGEILYTLDLSREKNRSFDIEYKGSKNTVEIKDGKIRVKDADCPDKTCVKTGWLSSSAMPIVCLPNHLVIEFSDTAGSGGEVDAVAR